MNQEPEFKFEDRVDSVQDEMELCQVTGRLTPHDEIVDLFGYRVCAEGKQEILRRLRAGLTLPGELETPGIGSRFLALLADSFIIGMVSILVFVVLGYNMFDSELGKALYGDHPDPALGVFRIQGAITLGLQFVTILYFAIFHARGGQTPGKMMARIKVVGFDGALISLKLASLRALYYAGPSALTTLPLIILTDVNTISMAYGTMSFLAGMWVMVDIILALMDRAEQKSLHDRLASTRVIVKG
ncbi:MAG: RDD family protein [Nitrospinota bacterium]|nr:RDD family protein [Nitrospinota bacterium]